MADFPIIRKLGGRKTALVLAQIIDPSVTQNQMRMWHDRGRISSDGQNILMKAAEHAKIAYVAADFEAIVEAAE